VAACPHCGCVLDPPPSGSRRCPECREQIVVRTREGQRFLLTPAGATRYDAERQHEFSNNRARRHAESLGIDEPEWRRAENELTARFGQPASASDVFWNLANHRAINAAAEGEWHAAQMTYLRMARHLREEGRESMHVHREALRCSVRNLLAEAAIIGQNDPPIQVLQCRPDCEVCRPDAGRIFRVEQLLSEDPPLPHDCGMCACGLKIDDAWFERALAADGARWEQMSSPMDAQTARRPSLLRRLFGG
jgi:hypothetical protein